jgi:hypothetical protein
MFGDEPRQADADAAAPELDHAGSDASYEPAFDDRPVPEAPATGDTAIDEAMTELAVAQAGSFEARIEAGERAHRLLQGRLGGLGEA